MKLVEVLPMSYSNSESLGQVRTYGSEDYTVILVHGGPGAPGEMRPIALELFKQELGVLEPFQSAMTLEGQIEELKAQIELHSTKPLYLLGHSWGAILALLTAARYPFLAKKVILVSSAVFEENDAVEIVQTRMNRLSEEDRSEFLKLMQEINDGSEQTISQHSNRIYELLVKSDGFAPIASLATPPGDFQFSAYQAIWPEFITLRKSGKLLEQISKYTGPVVAIHGDHDPHPASGVQQPLSKRLKQFSFISLTRCGHNPWIERFAMKEFYEHVLRELQCVTDVTQLDPL